MSTTPDIEVATGVAPSRAPSEAANDEIARDLALVFKALGDPTRIKLMAMIVGSSEGEMCVCDLTKSVGLSQPTVSHHMKSLVEAGLVECEQRGRWAYYRPTLGTLTATTEAFIAYSQANE